MRTGRAAENRYFSANATTETDRHTVLCPLVPARVSNGVNIFSTWRLAIGSCLSWVRAGNHALFSFWAKLYNARMYPMLYDQDDWRAPVIGGT